MVGDCCTDDSEQVVSAFGDSRLHWANLPARVGSQSGPNNEGLRRAQGEYIAYLGQDDLWFPWHLESLVATLEQSGADFAHALLAVFTSTSDTLVYGVPAGVRSYGQRFVPPSGWLHRQTVSQVCGPWPLPAGLVAGVDYVFQRRAFLAGFRFAASARLSVLKFPSPFFRIYAKSAEYPQPEYFDSMRRDPRALHDRLVMQLLVDSAQAIERLAYRPTARGILKGVHWRFIDWWGADRWPVSWYLRWRNGIWRKKVVVLRGLTPSPRR